MSIISTATGIIPGTYGPYFGSGAPTAGTNEVDTLTIGGTPTGGTFKLGYDGFTTAAITWSATNATLLANINAALVALPNVGASGWAATAGTVTAGIGTVTITAGGALAHKLLVTLTAADNSLTGSAPTLAIAKTTPGVTATHRSALIGARYVDTASGIEYLNTTAAPNPTWGKTGLQS